MRVLADDAVLEYAKALAKVNQSETIEIPTVADDGSVRRSKILIGPASQLIADEEFSDDDELVDEQLIASIQVETAKLTNRAYPVQHGDTQQAWVDEL